MTSYDCDACGRATLPDLTPSPCEFHHVCDGCAPCWECRQDAAEERAIRDRREAM